jgi:transcriptional regulator GlxA family with amidase domain
MVGPYEIFARTGRYNVYAVASSTASTTLTGGLRVRPHYSFDELDDLLEGREPAIVVTPNIPNVQSEPNRSLVAWVRQTAGAGATMLSWCAGAAVLAEAGLLDGRTATSHWGDLARLERDYPRVRWQRGVRWVDQGKILTSAGITSGIDATLRLLARTEGEGLARRIAEELRYPHFRFALDPRAEQYSPRLSDAVLFLNAAFRPSRQKIGVALYDGMGELDVSAIYDAHAAAGVAEVKAIAAETRLVRSAHGLWLEPELALDRDAADIRRLDRALLPGALARAKASTLALRLASAGAPAPEFVQADATRFSLEPVLEDLAATTDLATAVFAVRRLEYRSTGLRLSGTSLPLGALVALLSLVFLTFPGASALTSRWLTSGQSRKEVGIRPALPSNSWHARPGAS